MSVPRALPGERARAWPNGPAAACSAAGPFACARGEGAYPADSGAPSAPAYFFQTAQSLPEVARVQPAPLGDQLPGPIFIATLPLMMAA